LPKYSCELFNAYPSINLIQTDSYDHYYYNTDSGKQYLFARTNMPIYEISRRFDFYMNLLLKSDILKSYNFYKHKSVGGNFINLAPGDYSDEDLYM
jgi:hypothetical protein